jgi:hypothetical protein
VASVVAFSVEALHVWTALELACPEDGDADGVAGAAEEEDDDGAEVSGAAWLPPALGEPVPGSELCCPAGWLGPQAASRSASAAAAVVHISPLVIR